jgi:hypothetical protein
MGCGLQSEQICKEFLVMNNNNPIYKNLEFTWTDDVDYFVIISFATDNDYYIPNRTIVFQMEPNLLNSNNLWGSKMWGKWANPDPNVFLHVRQHPQYLNVAQWMFPVPKNINMIRKNKIIAIISEKTHDIGHKNRINFIKYVESLGYDIIDVYGMQNYHNFKNYCGTIDSKILQQEYKYVFSSENNYEDGYITEKLWESFISCSLCFYHGSPDADRYIYKNSYIPIDSSNEEETLQIMLDAIRTDLWSKYLPHIIRMKDITINEYGFFPLVSSIIN